MTIADKKKAVCKTARRAHSQKSWDFLSDISDVSWGLVKKNV